MRSHSRTHECYQLLRSKNSPHLWVSVKSYRVSRCGRPIANTDLCEPALNSNLHHCEVSVNQELSASELTNLCSCCVFSRLTAAQSSPSPLYHSPKDQPPQADLQNNTHIRYITCTNSCTVYHRSNVLGSVLFYFYFFQRN